MIIRFRGKNIKDNRWVYGKYTTKFNSIEGRVEHVISSDLGNKETIIHFETLSMFIGNYASYNIPIYTGDVLMLYKRKILEKDKQDGILFFAHAYKSFTGYCTDITRIGSDRTVSLSRVKEDRSNLEIVGNIWDNPEYLNYEKISRLHYDK